MWLMSSVRKIRFLNQQIYHVFNRGVERRNIFLSSRDRERLVQLLEYYRFANIPKSYSHFLNLSIPERALYYDALHKHSLIIDILAYCLMPNHFHLLVRQQRNHGVQEALSNISNGYAKYFNIKRTRVGPLFQGPFQAVRVETEEQLLHVSRYIHLNPVVSGVVDTKELFAYPWSSLPVYVGGQSHEWVEDKIVLSYFKNRAAYRVFVEDQIAFGKELEKIKHLVLE